MIIQAFLWFHYYLLYTNFDVESILKIKFSLKNEKLQ